MDDLGFLSLETGCALSALSSLPATAPPMRDLILQPDEVADKADRTHRQMEVLAHRDHAFAAGDLHKWIAMTFHLVQQAWEARDYANVRDLLGTELLAKHQKLLSSMRKNHEINRIENLRIERLEFVHLHCPRAVERQEVTALITFSASVYFVHDRTGAHTRGLRSSSCFQEFWTIRRQGESWLLQTIEQSHESDRLERANFVEELMEMEV